MTGSNNIKHYKIKNMAFFGHFPCVSWSLSRPFGPFRQAFFFSNYQFSDQDQNLGPPVFMVHLGYHRQHLPHMGTTLVPKSLNGSFGPGDGFNDFYSPDRWRWETNKGYVYSLYAYLYIYIFIHVCILFCVYKMSSRSLHKQMDITYRHSVEYL